MPVREAMLSSPTVHSASTPVADVRALLRDDHAHMALIVDRGRLVATVERQDLPSRDLDRVPARSIGVLAGRTVPPDAPLTEVAAAMRRAGRRRLAVVDSHGQLLGLLCLKAHGHGFCSADDVRERRESRAYSKRTLSATV
jgi:CBS domain-containing protein